MAKTVIGLYNSIERARDAMQDLVSHGFRQENISLMSRTESDAQDLLSQDMEHVEIIRPTGVDHEKRQENVAAGAGIGAALGGIGGFLVGAGALFIPGIGPILAAGPLMAALAGATLGAGLGAIAGALANMGVPEDEARVYAEGVRRGAILLAVSAPEGKADEVSEILAHHSPVDIRRQVAAWREAGWQGYDPKAEPLSEEQIERERSSFPLVEGEHWADQRDIESGVNSVEETGAERQAMRRTHVGVRELQAVRPWEDYEPDFRRDFERRWKGTSATWEEYQPAYRYAYDAAYDPRYQDRDWDDIEPELRRDWDDQYDTGWDHVADAIRAAWDRIRGY